MTVTAADIKKKIDEHAKCPGIDEWIIEILTPSFIQQNGGIVTVDERDTNKRWHKDNFIRALEERQFTVRYCAAERAVDYDHFEIGL